MTDGADDEALMRRVARGEQRALRTLMDRHMGSSIRLAERVTGSGADGDEIAQEAFVRVWRHAARFDPQRARFTTWLHRIVVNLSLDRKRKARFVDIDKAGDVAATAPLADEMLVAEERRRLARAAIDALPDRQRIAIALFHIEGYSMRDGAAVLDISEKSFESLLSRGRAACRQFIAAAEGGKGGRS